MISVLLPVHNGAEFLKQSIDSVLSQNYPNFELLILDDASSDESVNIANSFKDSRLKIFKNDFKSLAKNLNFGISLSKYNFIARLDQDDFITENRFKKQIEFLLKNPDYFAVFSYVNLIDTNGVKIGNFKPHINQNNKRFRILFENPFVHSSVMFRKNLFNFRYSEDNYLVPPEDFELWSRSILKHDAKIYVLKHKLTYYRVLNPHSMTQSDINLKTKTAKIIQRNFNSFYPIMEPSWVEFASERLQNINTTYKFNIFKSFNQIIKIFFLTVTKRKLLNLPFVFYFLIKIHTPPNFKKLMHY